MKRFIVKIVIFPIGLLLTYAILYYLGTAYLNSDFKHRNVVFIWGDSQAYQGIDLNELSSIINKKVYTTAHHGAGVYDFLIFTEQVPDDSEVIVSISKLGQIRRKENDYNRSGLSLSAMKLLYQNDYSIKEIFAILKLNIKPVSNIDESVKLYDNSDSLRIGLPLTHFESYYEKVPSFFREKQNLYLLGVKNLINKNCKISFVDFPLHNKLVNIENQSPIKVETDQFTDEVGALFKNFDKVLIRLDREQNIFYDLSHLNYAGANDLSKKKGKHLLKSKPTKMYMVR